MAGFYAKKGEALECFSRSFASLGDSVPEPLLGAMRPQRLRQKVYLQQDSPSCTCKLVELGRKIKFWL